VVYDRCRREHGSCQGYHSSGDDQRSGQELRPGDTDDHSRVGAGVVAGFLSLNMTIPLWAARTEVAPASHHRRLMSNIWSPRRASLNYTFEIMLASLTRIIHEA